MSANVNLMTLNGTEDSLVANVDPFGVTITSFQHYSLMDPVGSIVSFDLGTL
jgi:hypothetical protein